jgi:hypothetical protein
MPAVPAVLWSRGWDCGSDCRTRAGCGGPSCLKTSCRRSLKAAFLNQPLEFDDLRRTVQRIAGRPGFAQMVIRFGHSTVHGTTPRRPVSAFVHSSTEES